MERCGLRDSSDSTFSWKQRSRPGGASTGLFVLCFVQLIQFLQFTMILEEFHQFLPLIRAGSSKESSTVLLLHKLWFSGFAISSASSSSMTSSKLTKRLYFIKSFCDSSLRIMPSVSLTGFKDGFDFPSPQDFHHIHLKLLCLMQQSSAQLVHVRKHL